jgi:protein-tyrosine-phosphatase
MNILVLCTGNSARSILLESILNRDGEGRVSAWSAGSHPAGRVHPASLSLLEARGHDTRDLRSKSWDEFAQPDAPVMDAVVTVCGSAAGETCPVWPGAPIRAHWGIDDPAAATPDQWDMAFATAYDLLAARAARFLELGFESMDRAALEQAMQDIGRTT